MANLKAGSTIGGEAVLTAGNISSYNLNFLNGNVGIGTSPSFKLDVSAEKSNSFISRIWNTSTDSEASGLQVRCSGGDDGHSFAVYSDDAYQFAIKNTGNVGIGTVSPNAKLEVIADSVPANKPAVWLHNADNQTDRDGVVISSTNNGADAEVLHVRSNNTTYNGGTSHLLVRGDGNVGIGTTSPGAKLDIKNGGSGVWLSTNNLSSRVDFTRAGQNYINLTDQFPTDENSFEIGPGYINLNRDDDVPINQLSFGMNGTLGAAIEVGGGTPSSPNNQHSLRFKVGRDNLNNKAGIERMRITHTGNVGIGTTDPEGKLEISHTGSWDNPSIHLKGQYPTMKFNDTNAEDDWYIHVNSNNFYLLVDRNASGDEVIDKETNVWETPHPLQLEGDTNKGYLFANEIITAGNVGNFAQTSAFNGGTVTSGITIENSNPILTLKDTNGGDANSQSGYINFTDNNNTSRGWVGFGSTGDKIISIKNNIGGINFLTDTGTTVQANSSTVFTDAYHPNADQWTTSRTLTLGGDLSGSVSISGGANMTLTATVANDSHNHSAANITSGTLSSDRIPAATATNLGGVKVSYDANTQTLSITTT